MMKNFGLILSFVFCSIGTMAQYGESIRTGRPGQAIGPFTVGQNIFQVQSGFDYTQNKFDGFWQQTNTNYLFNNVFRYGITEHFELGLGANWQQDKISSDFGDFSTNGISGLSLRMRSNVMVGKGLKPTIGYQINLGLPVGSEDYRSDNVIPKLTIITGQSLTERIGFSTNFGFSWNDADNNPTKFYILNMGYSISDKWSCFIENYGFLKGGELDSRFDGGFAYLVNNNLQLDVFGGYDKLNQYTSEMFVSFGVSWRTARKEKE